MSQLIMCEECSGPLEHYRSGEEKMSDGRLHSFEEYLCRPCRTFVKVDVGVTATQRVQV